MVKKLLLSLVTLVLVVGLILVSTLDFWVKRAINTYGSSALGVPVEVSSVSLFPWNGSLSLHNLTIGNPQPFKEPFLLQADDIVIQVNLQSLLTHEIEINLIQVNAPHIVYETGFGGSNIGQLQKNINGSDTQAPSSPGNTTLVINNLIVTQAKVTGSVMGAPLNLNLPNIHLNNLGKPGSGVSTAQLSALLIQTLITNMGKLGVNVLTGSVKLIGDTAKAVTETTLDTIGDGQGVS